MPPVNHEYSVLGGINRARVGQVIGALAAAISSGLVALLLAGLNVARALGYAESLKTPDGTRCIIDSQAKFDGLTRLSSELDDLLREVAKEQAPWLGSDPSLEACRSVLATLVVADAA